MRIRSGHKLKRIEKPCPARQSSFLTCGMIRKNANDSSCEICSICLKKFWLKSTSYSLLQCPSCKHVYHTECLTSFILSAADVAKCPCCRAHIPYQIQNDHVIFDLLYKTWQFEIDGCSDKSYEEESEEEESEEEESEEDESSGEECN